MTHDELGALPKILRQCSQFVIRHSKKSSFNKSTAKKKSQRLKKTIDSLEWVNDRVRTGDPQNHNLVL